MKRAGQHPFTARLPVDLHTRLKASAAKCGRSINSHCANLLSTSLREYPTLERLPIIVCKDEQPFCIRFKTELHDALELRCKGISKRSLNQEIVARLAVMSGYSFNSVSQSWETLNRHLGDMLNGTVSPEALQSLSQARDSFEQHLMQLLRESRDSITP